MGSMRCVGFCAVPRDVSSVGANFRMCGRLIWWRLGGGVVCGESGGRRAGG